MPELRRPVARVWPGKRPKADPGPSVCHNDPASPGYTARHRQKVTELPGGTLRFDIGCDGS